MRLSQGDYFCTVLGHSTMRASLIYQYSTQERQRELADRMDAALQRRSAGVA